VGDPDSINNIIECIIDYLETYRGYTRKGAESYIVQGLNMKKDGCGNWGTLYPTIDNLNALGVHYENSSNTNNN
jgi:hypothetical protein